MRILIIGNFRTGSWHLHDALVKQHGLHSLGELFQGFRSQGPDADSRLSTFTDNTITKLHPYQVNNIDICLQLCELADTIIYTHRKNTLDQVVSYAVASQPSIDNYFEHGILYLSDITPWKEDRNPATKEPTPEWLDDAFTKLSENDKIIAELYKQYPGEVVIQEDIKPYNPYPHKYIYTGKWKLPYSFKVLGV